MLRAETADLAVVFAYRREREPAGFERHPLLVEPIFAVLPAGHPLAADPGLTLADLRDERWIAGCERCRDNLLTVCAAAGFAPDIRHSLDDFVLVQHLVAEGLGVALLPSLAFATFRHPDIAIRPLAGLGSREVAALVPEDADAIPSIALALDALQSAAAAVSEPAATPVA